MWGGNRTWLTLRSAAESGARRARLGTLSRARNLDPRVQGRELPLRERGGGAPPSPPRHGGRSTLYRPRPRESNSLEGRAAEVAAEDQEEEEAGASRRRRRRRRRRRGTRSPQRSSRPGRSGSCTRGDPALGAPPAPFRKSTWSRSPARNARGRGAGLLARPGDARTPSSRLSLSSGGRLGRRVPREVGEGGRDGRREGGRLPGAAAAG